MAYGFTRFELMGTLPGVRLYAVRGYVAAPQIEWPLGDGVHIQFVPMHKDAGAGPYDIAHCSPADAPAILELQTLAHESEARLYDDRTLPPLTQTLDDLRLELESATVLKALNTGRLVGSVRAREQDGTVHVGRLIVLPELQGRGLGTLLMRRIEACFPEAKRFELFTGNRSEASLRLYERLGYRRSREQMLSSSIALVFMEKQR
jgi:ribosomal protein S18 acetylase RimI-like enzyme